MKEQSTFKPLQGHLAFFRVRASRCPVHLRQQTQGNSRIPIAVEASSWGACGKFGCTSVKARESALISRQNGVHGVFLELLCWNWCSSRLETCVQGISGVAKSKSSHLLCMMWNAGWLWSQCWGIGLHLKLIWGTLSSFTFLR